MCVCVFVFVCFVHATILKLLFQKKISSTLQLFEVQLENSEVLLRYSSALVQGATNVFWYEFHSYFKILLIANVTFIRGFYGV